MSICVLWRGASPSAFRMWNSWSSWSTCFIGDLQEETNKFKNSSNDLYIHYKPLIRAPSGLPDFNNLLLCCWVTSSGRRKKIQSRCYLLCTWMKILLFLVVMDLFSITNQVQLIDSVWGGCHAVINGCFSRTKVQSSIASQYSSRELSIQASNLQQSCVFFSRTERKSPRGSSLPELWPSWHRSARRWDARLRLHHSLINDHASVSQLYPILGGISHRHTSHMTGDTHLLSH